MIKVAIAGVTGYTGREVLRYLINHPEVEIITLISRSHAGKRLSETGIPVPDYQDLILENPESAPLSRADVLFSCLPHTESAEFVKNALKKNESLRIIDLSADFRFHDPEVFEQIYGKKHPFPEGCQMAAYGIPELNRENISKSQIIACPGCYPTCFLLACAPIIREKIEGTFIFDAKSGISGAGKKMVEGNLFSEIHDNVRPYNVFTHRHQAEMEFQARALFEAHLTVAFFPQVIPASRGILGNLHIITGHDPDELRSLFADFYCSEPFVKLLPEGKNPETLRVRGTNYAHLQIYSLKEKGVITVSCAIDNLGKGAAGQAVQNMNLMAGLPETTGLEGSAFHP